MEAIILAGGFGTRLRAVVPNIPKPMAPVAGRPFLEILLDNLAKKGFKRVILSLGYMAEHITDHFEGVYAGIELVPVVEERPLGTGGGVRLAMDQILSDHVYVFNGDTFLDLEVLDVESAWLSRRRPIIVARDVKDTNRYGRLVVEDGCVVGFMEKGVNGPGLINAGCYILPKGALADFPLNTSFSLEKDFLIPLANNRALETFVTTGQFIDIGIPEDFNLAQTMLTP